MQKEMDGKKPVKIRAEIKLKIKWVDKAGEPLTYKIWLKSGNKREV